MKWKEIQEETLRNMFRDITLEEAKQDDECALYLLLMPNKANEALLRICTNYIKLPKQYMLNIEDNELQYNLKEQISNFYEFINITFKDGRYLSRDKYIYENGILILPEGFEEENLIINYNSYPTKITSETKQDYVLDVPEEVAILIPAYIASELYKDDDIQHSVILRNQFEASLSELRQTNKRKGYISTKGWL